MALSKRAVEPWRARFLSACGIPRERALGVRQVHSRNIVIIEDQTAEECASIEADGMVTDRGGTALTVTVADCLPVFLIDTKRDAYALVHSGWKGTGISLQAVRSMARCFGSMPADLSVTIGPGIGACCYEVPEERAGLFSAEFGDGSVVREPGRGPRLDLRAANVRLLTEAGVGEIVVVNDCTRCSARLGSFRRQGAADYALMLAYFIRRG
jgi:YfiH family protein